MITMVRIQFSDFFLFHLRSGNSSNLSKDLKTQDLCSTKFPERKILNSFSHEVFKKLCLTKHARCDDTSTLERQRGKSPCSSQWSKSFATHLLQPAMHNWLLSLSACYRHIVTSPSLCSPNKLSRLVKGPRDTSHITSILPLLGASLLFWKQDGVTLGHAGVNLGILIPWGMTSTLDTASPGVLWVFTPNFPAAKPPDNQDGDSISSSKIDRTKT